MPLNTKLDVSNFRTSYQMENQRSGDQP